MKKILFLNFVCNWCPHFETELELMLDLMNKGNDVYSVSCNKIFNKFCISNQQFDSEFCNECCTTYKEGLKLINFPKKNILKLSKIKCPEFPLFKTAQELSDYSIDGINLGFGVYTSYMSISRDYMFDIDVNRQKIEGYLKTAYTVTKNMEQILKELKPDEVYLFNGRFIESWPVIELCKRLNIDYYTHERGSSSEKYQLIKNDLLHKADRLNNEIHFYWNKAKEPQRSEIAKKWFNDRRNGAEQSWIAFAKEQKKGALPENFDKLKNNIAIFNSSLDECYAFEDWQNPVARNENEIIKLIMERYKDDDSRHFYLRVHPNLKGIVTTQMEEIENISKANYNNLTIIHPEASIDSYSLIAACNKIISFGSTVGVEAAFLNKVSILAGVSVYSQLDCCYVANNYKEFFNFIESDIKPKNPKNTYPFGYWSTVYGTSFKYFEPDGLFKGIFLGKNLRKRKLSYKIAREIRYPFKKILKKLAVAN